ncbi:MAG: hypothetical protein QGI45_06725 [Myxococcota bacterium]|jgi:hypothetical protein|nr:hypothetical protein [Myxococcota bacterium]
MQVSNTPRAINIDTSSSGAYTATDESTKMTREMLADDKKKKATNPLDKDGDGVADGESLAGDANGAEGAVINQDLLSKILNSQGLTMGANGLNSMDGFAIATATNGSAAVDFGSNAPILPAMTQSANVDYELMGDRLNALSANSMEDGALMWHALSETARGSREDMAMTKQLRFAMEKQKYASKMKELKAKEEEIDAQKEAAVWSAVASIASVAVASFAGGQNMGVAMGAQQAMSQTVNAISVNWGPQAEANQKALDQKSEQIVQSTLDEAIESLKGNYDAAREAHRQSLEVIQKHCELASQNVSAITKG